MMEIFYHRLEIHDETQASDWPGQVRWLADWR